MRHDARYYDATIETYSHLWGCMNQFSPFQGVPLSIMGNKDSTFQETLSEELEHKLDTLCEALRDYGYRVTVTRRLLLRQILSNSPPVTAHGLYEQAQANRLKIGLATIYRTLEKLEVMGLLQRVHDNQGCHSYVMANNQALLAICQSCGQTASLHAPPLQSFLLQWAQQTGYQVQGYSVHIAGLCPECQEGDQ